MTTIEQIRAEIERRKKALHSTLFNDEYNELLSFLDTLQEQTVTDCNELQEPEVDLVKAAIYVWESWNGGTMDDVRRDMKALGEIVKAIREK